MFTFTRTTDPNLARLPPDHRPAVLHALATLCTIYGHPPAPEEEGFVAYVEAQDTPQSLRSAIGRNVEALEGVYRDGPCLVGVILWNNEAGVTLVCPDLDDHAPQIVRTLRHHL